MYDLWGQLKQFSCAWRGGWLAFIPRLGWHSDIGFLSGPEIYLNIMLVFFIIIIIGAFLTDK